MTRATESPRQQDSPSRSSRWTLVLVAIVVSALAMPALVGGVAAQNETNETAPYYENTSVDDVENESWMAGNEDPTIANITTYLSRIGTFVIGSDPADSNAPTAPIILGLMVLGGALGTMVGTDMGIVSGAVLSILSLAAVSAVGIFPSWLYAVGLFGVGLMLSASFKRVVA